MDEPNGGQVSQHFFNTYDLLSGPGLHIWGLLDKVSCSNPPINNRAKYARRFILFSDGLAWLRISPPGVFAVQQQQQVLFTVKYVLIGAQKLLDYVS